MNEGIVFDESTKDGAHIGQKHSLIYNYQRWNDITYLMWSQFQDFYFGLAHNQPLKSEVASSSKYLHVSEVYCSDLGNLGIEIFINIIY